MNICKTGPNDLQPPEPVEEAEFKIKIQRGCEYLGEFEFSAEELNMHLCTEVDAMHARGVDHPIYLNGTQWKGNQLDEQDMAEL